MSKKSRLWLCACLIAVNLMVIWGNSLLPGEISSAISDWVKAVLTRLFSGIQGPDTPGSGLLRKAAHFLEFAALGLLISWLHSILLGVTFQGCLRSLLWGISAAAVDESIQRFVPGRHGCVTDVLIDTAGVIAGIALLWGMNKVKKHDFWRKTK